MKTSLKSLFQGALNTIVFAIVLSNLTQNIFAQNGYCMVNGSTTGGAGGSIVTVSNEADLKAYATSSSPYIIKVSGTITLSSRLDITANKTVLGVNISSKINGNIAIGVNNVIIRNLTFTNPLGTGLGDGISIWGGTHVWVDHVTFVDCADGSCDINHLADYVTVSNCKFYYVNQTDHRFAMILGGDPYDAPGDNLHVTLNHNWFADKCDQRMPSGSYSNAHVYNNYFSCSGNYYCTNARIGAHWLVQNNYYNGVGNPCNYQSGGIMQISGNIYNNCTGDQFTASNGSVSVPYSYSLTPTASVSSLVSSNAGNVSSKSAFSTIEAENYNGMSGIQTESCSEGGLNVGYINNGDWIQFSNIDFGIGAGNFSARVASNAIGGTISIRLDGVNGTEIGTCLVSSTGGWQTWSTVNGNVSSISGVHDLYLVFSGGSGYLFNFNNFVFEASSSGGLISDGCYGIIAKHSGKSLDVYNFSLDNGGNIVQWPYLGGTNQQFNVSNLDGEYYSIINVISDKALDVDNYSIDNGGNIQQWSYLSGSNQQFKFVSTGDGYYQIVNRLSGKCLDVEGVSTADGANIQQYNCGSGTNQRFQMNYLSGLKDAAATTNIISDISSNDLKLYPNPTSNYLNLSVAGLEMNNIKVVVYNTIGELVYIENNIENNSVIDISNLSPGIYILEMTADHKVVSSMFSKK